MKRFYMRYLRIFLIIGGLWISPLVSCEKMEIFPQYVLELPELPPAWRGILGEPRWRVSWVGRDGRFRRFDGSAASLPEIEVPVSGVSPVFAYPYWPKKGIEPGMMRPAGAILPFDIQAGKIRPSWRGGAEAEFLRGLARSRKDERAPYRFNWPQFRELLWEIPQGIPDEIREDPWRADWLALGEAAGESGFDRRRIRARKTQEIIITMPDDGPWTGNSPFGGEFSYRRGDKARLPCGAALEILASPGGILKFTQDSWSWTPCPGENSDR